MTRTTSNGRSSNGAARKTTPPNCMSNIQADLAPQVAAHVREALDALVPALAEQIAAQVRQQIHALPNTASVASPASLNGDTGGASPPEPTLAVPRRNGRAKKLS